MPPVQRVVTAPSHYTWFPELTRRALTQVNKPAVVVPSGSVVGPSRARWTRILGRQFPCGHHRLSVCGNRRRSIRAHSRLPPKTAAVAHDLAAACPCYLLSRSSKSRAHLTFQVCPFFAGSSRSRAPIVVWTASIGTR